MNILKWSAAAIAVAALVAPVSAQTVYNNGTPLNGGTTTPDLTGEIIYENFLFGSGGATFNTINFYGYNTSTLAANPASIFYTIFDAQSYYGIDDEPIGSSLYSGTITPTVTSTSYTAGPSSLPVSLFTLTLPAGITLGSGSYVLGLHDGPLSSGTASTFYWAKSSSGNAPVGSFEIPSEYTSAQPVPASSPLFTPDYGEEFAFNLAEAQPVVPEPATMSLLAFGLVGLAGMKRRSRKQA